MVKLFLTASRKATGSNQCCPQVFLGTWAIFDPVKSWQIQMTITI
jgi:hypothetical protein